jgi:hypothetical protein
MFLIVQDPHVHQKIIFWVEGSLPFLDYQKKNSLGFLEISQKHYPQALEFANEETPFCSHGFEF